MSITVSISVDEEAANGMRSMPRSMSASRYIRHMIKAATYDEKKWLSYKKTEECKIALEYLRPFRERFVK